MDNRKSFVFYASWWEAIRNLQRDLQGEVLTAIIEYGLYGETTEELKPIAKALLIMAQAQIDVNVTRFENGRKGGAPKGKVNNPNGRRGKKVNVVQDSETNQELTETNQELTETNQELTETNQELTETNQRLSKNKPNVNVNVNENVNENENDNFSLTQRTREIENGDFVMLANSQMWKEQVCITISQQTSVKLNPRAVVTYLQMFQSEMEAKEYLHQDVLDMKAHFVSWLKIQMKARGKDKKSEVGRDLRNDDPDKYKNAIGW